ncbi:MAG: hypothetical protein MN733_03850 [Nitrososphaera sp.]|nr:hypothetical protein [Nitrososphaera sp.]
MEFQKQLYPPGMGMSPQFAMNRFKGAMAKYGQQKVLRESRFQKAREMWASAAFLTGLSKLTEKTYWVAPEYNNQTPDTYGISFKPHAKYEGGKMKEVLNIEVSEYEQHASGDLVETIKRKLNGKAYPEYYVLLIYGIRPGERVDLEIVFQELSKETFSVDEIFLLASVSGGSENVYKVVSLFRKRASIDFSVDEELAKSPTQTDMITWSRGLGDDFLIEERHVLRLPDL